MEIKIIFTWSFAPNC